MIYLHYEGGFIFNNVPTLKKLPKSVINLNLEASLISEGSKPSDKIHPSTYKRKIFVTKSDCSRRGLLSSVSAY